MVRGSVQCTCHTGYRLTEDGRTCQGERRPALGERRDAEWEQHSGSCVTYQIDVMSFHHSTKPGDGDPFSHLQIGGTEGQ